MGHRRLSIIDLSTAARQPFHDAAGRHVVAFNGEIYNYVELRTELEREGARFRTQSDTEVLVEAFARWGTRALDRFDGMFAGALHDRASGRHFLFRDPLGQKPLYYAVRGDHLVYASELRALLALPWTWRLDRDALRRYLAFGYYPWDGTPLQDVRKLLPGCLLRVEGRTVACERWWNSIPGADPLDLGYDEAVTEVERLFDRSCAIALRADVPSGVLLSGGIDSTLVLSSCHAVMPNLQSFSVQMGEADFDETDKARTAVRHVGATDHHVFRLDPETILDALGAFLSWVDEPHADPGFVNAYFLARACRPMATVALAGDGADELFCGYLPFRGLGLEGKVAALPEGLLGPLKAAADLIPGSDRYLGLHFKARSFLQAFPAPPALRPAWWLATLPPEMLARLLPARGEFFDRAAAAPASALAFLHQVPVPAGATPVQRLLAFYQGVFLPEFVCQHTDRAAMQVALEVRSPFLSAPLIAFANRLPDKLKLRNGRLKSLLKSILTRRGFPPALVGQRKQGFTFPLARWLKGPLRPRLEAMLADPAAWTGGEVDAAALGALAAAHAGGRADNARILHALVVFQAWRQRHAALEFA